MSDELKCPIKRTESKDIRYFGKMYLYPCGIADMYASSEPVFGPRGWELAERYDKPQRCSLGPKQARESFSAQAEDLERAMRRARAKLRRLALANDFRWFVTLTFDPAKVDSHDGAAVVKKLSAWCSNMVQRRGLRYVLVPEFHKSGAIHFHGFFSDNLEVVESGTIKRATGGKPRKPRSEAERRRWLDEGGSVVYNLPVWTLGFTTAMELYGEYPAAVAYVCKYIGKDGKKPAGRWYYSGGELREPRVEYLDLSPADLACEYGEKALIFYPPGKQIAVVNGVKCTPQSTEDVRE